MPYLSPRQCCLGAAVLASLTYSATSFGWLLTINKGPKSVFLQVGNGSLNDSVGTVNEVSLTVPVGQAGNGSPLQMTSDSSQAASPADGFNVCVPPAQVYVGGYYRRPNNAQSATAILEVSSPAALNAAGESIPFSQISWTSTALINPTAHIPAGTFNGGQQTLFTLPSNYYVENCLTFYYANSAIRGAGTYVGRVTYTLTSP